MSSPRRPSPRPAFLVGPRRFSVRSYGRDESFFPLAQEVFEGFGLRLDRGRAPRALGASTTAQARIDDALDERVDAIRAEVHDEGLFFVEEVSIQPGEPTAILRCDLALHVPGLTDPVLVFAETRGALSTPACGSPDSFVPEGASRSLRAMSSDESWRCDPRIAALVALVERLEEYAAVVNLPSSALDIRSEGQRSRDVHPRAPHPRAFVVLGPSCAGKTSLARMVKRIAPDLLVSEASSIVRSFARRADGALSPLAFAQKLLGERGMDVVARRWIELYEIGPSSEFLISGLRTIEELVAVCEACPATRVVLVETSVEDRYERQIDRARQSPMDLEAFVAHDTEQRALGLLAVAEHLADVRIRNDGTKGDLERAARALVAGERPSPQDSRDREGVNERDPRDPAAVTHLLLAIPELARRADGGNVELTDAGRALRKLLELRARDREESLKRTTCPDPPSNP